MGALVTTLRANVTTLGAKPRKRGVLVARNVTTLIAVVTILAACTTTKGSYCAIADANRPSQSTIDAMTDAEVERALVELEKLRRLCGVKP